MRYVLTFPWSLQRLSVLLWIRSVLLASATVSIPPADNLLLMVAPGVIICATVPAPRHSLCLHSTWCRVPGTAQRPRLIAVDIAIKLLFGSTVLADTEIVLVDYPVMRAFRALSIHIQQLDR